MSELQNWRLDLRATDVETRASAAENLCLAGPDAAGATVDLVRACADVEDVQVWAVSALEELGPPPEAALGELTELMSSPEPLVAYWATTLVGRLESAALPSEEAVLRVLTTATDAAVCERAAWALGNMRAHSASTVQALKTAAHSDSPRLREIAQTALTTVQ